MESTYEVIKEGHFHRRCCFTHLKGFDVVYVIFTLGIRNELAEVRNREKK